ncbi:MAG TPA: GIY-YIG nuclease family protein [Thermoanaerobaculia bacterium]|nr:GIY-YIG nuclease family protein [Thermoanaerobaculia bacterium]
MEPRAFVYIVSNKSHSLYVGITTDLRARFDEHRSGAYPNGFTARYHFDRLVFYEPAATLAAAAKREKEIKGWRREKKVALIQSMNPNWHDLSSRLDPLGLLL